MKHPVIDALAALGRSSGPRTVAVLIAMVERAEFRSGRLTFEGGCRQLGKSLQMAPSSVNDQLNKLKASGFIERNFAGSTSWCVIQPGPLGLVLEAEHKPKSSASGVAPSRGELPGPRVGLPT